jgi:hypothetical protein
MPLKTGHFARLELLVFEFVCALMYAWMCAWTDGKHGNLKVCIRRVGLRKLDEQIVAPLYR